MDAGRELSAGSTLSRYTIVEKIGEGGMGVVYKALDNRLSRHVAVKVLGPAKDPDPARRRRFLREARAAAAVTHPGIAVVHEIDEADGVTFIVMELAEGTLLEALLAKGPLPLEQALRIATRVAAALARAHQAGIVHSDLKPGNLVVAGDGEVKILDFGLARILSCDDAGAGALQAADDVITLDASMAGRLRGTAPYMSPEQARGEPAGPHSDVFSFGVVLYEMLTGRRPFTGRTVSETLARVLEAEPEPAASFRADLPPWLDATVSRCLRKAQEERFVDGGELLSALTDRTLEAVPAVSPSTIAVFPFTVRGGAEFEYLGVGMVDLLGTKLDGAGEIRSVDPHVILCCPMPSGGPREPGEAAALAQRFGAGLFVLGSVLAVGTRLRLEASLYEALPAPRVVARSTAQGEVDSIFDLVDQLTAGLLADRCGGPGTRLSRIAAMATGSFPALKAYLEGEQEMRAMRRLPAVDAYQKAVAADPGFALAWYRLGLAALWSGQSRLSREASEKAVAHASRLSDRDRRLLEAFEASLRGRNDDAAQRLRAIVGLHPDDVDAWYQLAEILFHCAALEGRRLEHSRRAWERLQELDPRNASALVHLCAVESSEGRWDEFEKLLGRILETSPEGDAARWVRARRAFTEGSAADQERTLASLREATDYQVVYTTLALGTWLGRPEGALRAAGVLAEPMRVAPVRAMGHVLSAWIQMSRGRWSETGRPLDRAASLDPWRALEARALLALAPFVSPPEGELSALIQRLEETSPPACGPRRAVAWLHPHDGVEGPVRAWLIGQLGAKLGRLDLVQRQAEFLESATGPDDGTSLIADLALSLRSWLAVSRGDHAEALALLERTSRQARFDTITWSPLHSRCPDRWARAELLLHLGRGEEARRWYQSFMGTSLYDNLYVAPGLARLRRLDAEAGRVEAAAADAEQLECLWAQADTEVRAWAERGPAI